MEEELSRDITTSVILKKLKNYILLDMSSHFIGTRVSQLSGTLTIFQFRIKPTILNKNKLTSGRKNQIELHKFFQFPAFDIEKEDLS